VLLDNAAHYSGSVPTSRLLLASPDQPVAEMRTEPLLSVLSDADETDVFELFDKYNLRTLTVVDAENRPIGIIAVDDVVSRLVQK
jgi:magnesium transporter